MPPSDSDKKDLLQQQQQQKSSPSPIPENIISSIIPHASTPPTESVVPLPLLNTTIPEPVVKKPAIILPQPKKGGVILPNSSKKNNFDQFSANNGGKMNGKGGGNMKSTIRKSAPRSR
jgi:hypothetical protein